MENPDTELTEILKNMAKTLGTCNVGITTKETLKDGILQLIWIIF